jgi:hypothetical protein
MKNTGKRIFASVLFAIIVAMPVLVSAGMTASQR